MASGDRGRRVPSIRREHPFESGMWPSRRRAVGVIPIMRMGVGLTCVLLQAKGSRGMRLRAHTPSDVEVGGQEATSRRPRLEQLGLLRVNGRALASTPPQI